MMKFTCKYCGGEGLAISDKNGVPVLEMHKWGMFLCDAFEKPATECVVERDLERLGAFLAHRDTTPTPTPLETATGHPRGKYEQDTTATRTLSEEGGNKLWIRSGEIKLQLATENFARSLGRITSRGIEIIRQREKHLHRKSDSYGINYMMLKHLPNIDKVIIRDEHGEYEVSRRLITEKGRIMHFKFSADGNQYELQHFIGLKEIGAR